MKRFLVAALLLVMCAVPAFAGKCSEDGCAGGTMGGGGGGGYTQRDSGLWVPNQDGYIQQRSAPIVTPAVERFGQDVLRDVAKDAVKLAIGGVLLSAKKVFTANIHTLTLTGWSYR